MSDQNNILLEDTNKDCASDGIRGNTFMTLSNDHDRDSIDMGTTCEVGTPRS